MRNPDPDQVILKGKARDSDGNWIWGSISPDDWATIVPLCFCEVGIFEHSSSSSSKSDAQQVAGSNVLAQVPQDRGDHRKLPGSRNARHSSSGRRQSLANQLWDIARF